MKADTTHDKRLADTIKEALRLRDLQRADGASESELKASLERTIRASWPFTREWFYDCEACQDTGLVIRECRAGARCNGISTRVDHWKEKPGKYERLCRQDLNITHTYGEPCTCKRGDRFKPGRERTPDDALEVAAKTSKPTRWGR